MKSFKIVLLIVSICSLFVFLSVVCSAATLRNNQVELSGDYYPFGQNFAQPYYSTGSDPHAIQWANPNLPNNATYSAYNAILPFYSVDNNQMAIAAQASTVPSYDNVNYGVVGLFTGGTILGFDNVNDLKSFSGSYLHIVIDFGGTNASHSTSGSIIQNVPLHVSYYRGTTLYDFVVPISSDRKAFITIPTLSFSQSTLKIYFKTTASTHSYLSNGFLYVNYVWAINDNQNADEFYTNFNYLDYTAGVNSIWYANHGFPSVYYTDENAAFVISEREQYWYDLGLAEGENTTKDYYYQNGYDAGVLSVTEQSGDPVSIKTAIFAVPNAMVHLLRSLFDFTIAGFNLFTAFKFLLALLAVCFVARLIMRSLV